MEGEGTQPYMTSVNAKPMLPLPANKNSMLSKSMWNPSTHANINTTDTTKTLALFVVNSVKLHLTAFKNKE